MKERDLQNFIYFITHHKSMTRKQVVRRDSLLLRDIYNNNKIKKENKVFIQLSALDTSLFLSKFNEPKELKYLTHDFDDINDGRPRTIKELIKVVNENLPAMGLPPSLRGLINGYVSDGNWLDTYGKKHHSYIGSPEWLSWSENHNNLHPIRNPDFIQEIDAFGSTIRLRDGGLDIMCNKATEHLCINLVRNGTDSADFYTNTYCLFSALQKVFAQMNKARQYPNVRISVETSTDMEGRMLQVITITQDGSFSSNSIEHVKNRLNTRNEPGDFGAIRKYLNGYCLWQVENIWSGQPRRLNILRAPGMDEVEEIQSENISGFTHKFTFY